MRVSMKRNLAVGLAMALAGLPLCAADLSLGWHERATQDQQQQPDQQKDKKKDKKKKKDEPGPSAGGSASSSISCTTRRKAGGFSRLLLGNFLSPDSETDRKL